MASKDGALIGGAQIIGGTDIDLNTWPLQCDINGILQVELAAAQVPIDVLVNNIVPVSQSGTWTVQLASEPVIDIGEVSIKPANTFINIFSTGSASYGVETTILTYTNVGISWVTQIVGWGQYDGEFLIYINGVPVGGGRTSPANRTLQLSEPFSTIDGDIITVTILEYGPGMQQFRCNLIGQ